MSWICCSVCLSVCLCMWCKDVVLRLDLCCTQDIDFISDTLSEGTQKNFKHAFERFTSAEDLFKSKEKLAKEEADRVRAEKQAQGGKEEVAPRGPSPRPSLPRTSGSRLTTFQQDEEAAAAADHRGADAGGGAL